MTAGALLLFARCAGFVSRAPGLSYPGVPPMLRAAVALGLCGALLPVARAPLRLDDERVACAVVLEFLIGAALGAGASVLYDGAYAAGRLVDDYVGIKAIAPSVQLVAPSGFGRIWSLAFTGGFFLLGGYRVALLAFAHALTIVPLGTIPASNSWTVYGASIATGLARVALEVAAPAVAAAFLVQVALGALSRTIPRFGSLTLAFPLVFGAALVATAASVP